MKKLAVIYKNSDNQEVMWRTEILEKIYITG